MYPEVNGVKVRRIEDTGAAGGMIDRQPVNNPSKHRLKMPKKRRFVD
jgi:hypothetical protein